MGNVLVHHGNAPEMGGFKHIRAGHEIARPVALPNGETVLRTATGRMFKTRKI